MAAKDSWTDLKWSVMRPDLHPVLKKKEPWRELKSFSAKESPLKNREETPPANKIQYSGAVAPEGSSETRQQA